MNDMPDTPNPQTRTAVTTRITTHVKQGWPHLGEPVVTFRGQFCYVAAHLPGHRQPSPILRLRYLPLRPPAVMAKAAASLDVISVARPRGDGASQDGREA